MQVIRPADERSPSPMVVTGAARGIGLTIARLAARAGASVALLDRDGEAVRRQAEALAGATREALAATTREAVAGATRDALPGATHEAVAGATGDALAGATGEGPAGARREAVADTTGEPGGEALGIRCDVTDERDVRAAFHLVSDRLGAPRAVVACAGIDRGGPLHELDAATWDAVLDVNLRGTFLTCREALRHMLAAGGGSIVCVSSTFAFAAAPHSSAYSSSKGGISALVRSLAVDYGRRGIRVNAILPGPTETELMWASVAEADVDAVRDTVEREVPLGRLADPEEPARAALWLLSDAASYVTGAQLACDGGVLAKAAVSV